MALISWPMFFSYDFESPKIACSMNWEASDFSSGAYIVYLFLFGLVIPVVVILYAYSHILFVINKVRLSYLVLFVKVLVQQ